MMLQPLLHTRAFPYFAEFSWLAGGSLPGPLCVAMDSLSLFSDSGGPVDISTFSDSFEAFVIFSSCLRGRRECFVASCCVIAGSPNKSILLGWWITSRVRVLGVLSAWPQNARCTIFWSSSACMRPSDAAILTSGIFGSILTAGSKLVLSHCSMLGVLGSPRTASGKIILPYFSSFCQYHTQSLQICLPFDSLSKQGKDTHQQAEQTGVKPSRH